ncbi:Pectin lyase-like superfamily protein [Rhynchospora pubera]|uniref:Pectin lyase-like superfamily protein n=1 Tax=Rhynchospora pubera TaxID=906938 RepID=A0AAV8AQ27_9POAL|nr:Pectin lyase-like superfamily protein [Rhynchospora pubera]
MQTEHEGRHQKTALQVYYEDITFRDNLFDSNHHGGGQTETIGGDKREKDFSGIAISLDGNDHAVTDVAIFSAEVGANILTGVHCYNKATGFGGVGILGKASCAQTRIDNCYMDYNSILLAMSSSGQSTEKQQEARKTVAGKGKKWTADFQSVLVFKDLVSHVDYSLYVKNHGGNTTLPAHAITSVKNNKVVVEATAEVDGVVSVAVDQYLAPGEDQPLALIYKQYVVHVGGSKIIDIFVNTKVISIL